MTDTTRSFLNEQQITIRNSARWMASEIIAPTAAGRDLKSAWPHTELQSLAELGFLDMLVPEAYGGAGASVLDFCLAQHEFAAIDAGLATILHVHNFTALCIAEHGTEAQKQRYLPAMVSGKSIGAFLLTEPHAGFDTAALRTTTTHSTAPNSSFRTAAKRALASRSPSPTKPRASVARLRSSPIRRCPVMPSLASRANSVSTLRTRRRSR